MSTFPSLARPQLAPALNNFILEICTPPLPSGSRYGPDFDVIHEKKFYAIPFVEQNIHVCPVLDSMKTPPLKRNHLSFVSLAYTITPFFCCGLTCAFKVAKFQSSGREYTRLYTSYVAFVSRVCYSK